MQVKYLLCSISTQIIGRLFRFDLQNNANHFPTQPIDEIESNFHQEKGKLLYSGSQLDGFLT